MTLVDNHESDRIFTELCAKYTHEGDPAFGDDIPVNFDLIAKWSRRCEMSELDLLDSLAVRLARSFAQDEVTFGLGDAIANDLYGVCLDDRVGDFPAVFWAVFEAFDAGEFQRSSDLSDDPVSEHTMPMIKELLARLDN